MIILTSWLLQDEAAALRRAGATALLLKGTEFSTLLMLREAVLPD